MEPHATGPVEAKKFVSRFWDLVLVFALPLLALVFLARGCGGPPL